MWIYVLNLTLIFYWWFFYEITIANRLKKGLTIDQPKKALFGRIFLILPFVQIYLMLSLKNITVGTDTISYLSGFNLTLYTRWQDIFNFNIQGLVYNFERGFIALSKFITLFTDDFTVYSFIIYAIMIIPLYIFIKKHSVMPFLSIILFINLGFLNFYFSGMRQAIAFSIVLLSYDYIIKRKILKFLLIIVIASLIHQSALFFIPAYFLFHITITPLVGLFYFISLAVVYIFRANFFELVTQFIYTGKEIEETGAYTLLLIVFLTFVVGMFSYNNLIKTNGNNKFLYTLIGIAVILMVFNTISNASLRVANYYYLFMIVFIPTIITSYDKQLRLMATTIVIIFTTFYYLRFGVNSLGGTPYSFFWQ